MPAADILDRLLVTLAVRLHAFSVCQIQEGWRLSFDAFDAITIHYVLAGAGSVRAGNGDWIPFAARNIIIVPARQPQTLGQADRAVGEARGEDHCTLIDDGLVAFTAGDGSRDTLLICGMISASYGGAFGLFDHLRDPLVEDLSSDNALRHAFDLMLTEIAEPSIGTQAMTEVLMKQCLIALLRRHLLRGGEGSPLFAALHDRRLARAVMAILEEPAAAHTVESLAACAGMSRASFSDRFAQAFRQSPMDFVQKVRLRIAARLLRTTDLPVKVVCGSIGYASRSAFTRAFRSAYGVDPKTFRSVGGHEEGEPESIEDEAGRHAASGSG
jgi:AraC family transcriptional regulator, activator of mtrCDE